MNILHVSHVRYTKHATCHNESLVLSPLSVRIIFETQRDSWVEKKPLWLAARFCVRCELFFRQNLMQNLLTSHPSAPECICLAAMQICAFASCAHQYGTQRNELLQCSHARSEHNRMHLPLSEWTRAHCGRTAVSEILRTANRGKYSHNACEYY